MCWCIGVTLEKLWCRNEFGGWNSISENIILFYARFTLEGGMGSLSQKKTVRPSQLERVHFSVIDTRLRLYRFIVLTEGYLGRCARKMYNQRILTQLVNGERFCPSSRSPLRGRRAEPVPRSRLLPSESNGRHQVHACGQVLIDGATSRRRVSCPTSPARPLRTAR